MPDADDGPDSFEDQAGDVGGPAPVRRACGHRCGACGGTRRACTTRSPRALRTLSNDPPAAAPRSKMAPGSAPLRLASTRTGLFRAAKPETSPPCRRSRRRRGGHCQIRAAGVGDDDPTVIAAVQIAAAADRQHEAARCDTPTENARPFRPNRQRQLGQTAELAVVLEVHAGRAGAGGGERRVAIRGLNDADEQPRVQRLTQASETKVTAV